MITGGTGSVGMELARSLLRQGPREVRLFTNDENGLFEARSIFGKKSPVKYFLGDVRDRRSVERAAVGCDVVFHAAALKHVDFCEMNPSEAISTNIIGTQNVIESARSEGVRRLVYVSTDKAVNPISTMGATKLLSEKLVVNAGDSNEAGSFCCVRFGNILGSRGSVLRIFEREIMEGKPVTVTNPEMTRFTMLPSEAAGLVLSAGALANSGETYVLRMPAVRVMVLAEAGLEFFCERFKKNPRDFHIKVIGSNPEEKMHEELMTVQEQQRSILKGDFYVIPSPSQFGRSGKRTVRRASGYSSESTTLLTKKQVVLILKKLYASA